MPHVLLLTDVLGGGTGNHLFSLARHWHATAWTAEAISSAAPRARIPPDLPIRVLTPRHRFDRYPLSQFHRFGQIRRQVVARPPDLVHSYFFWSILYGRMLKRLGVIRRLVENREDQGFSWGNHEYALLRATRALPDRVICVADAVKETVMRRERLPRERITVIHNGIDPPPRIDEKNRAAVRTEFGFSEDHLVVGLVANFNRTVKGVSHFLDSIPPIVAAVPHARFLILGRGPQESQLRQRAQRLGIESCLVFAGFREDIDRCYAGMNIAALTSLSEGLSMTLLESMNHGLPLIATRVGGNSELVVDGETGILVRPCDPGAFAREAIELLKDAPRRQRLGNAARQRVAALFRLDRVASRYLEVYNQLMSPRASSAGGISKKLSI